MNNIFDKLNMVFIKTRKLSWQVLFTIIFILFISLYVNRNVFDFRIDQIMILKLFIIIAVSLSMVEFLARGRIDWHKSRINIPIFLFILVMTISLLRSDFFRISLNDYIIFLFYIILCFLIRNNLPDKIELKSFIKTLFLTSFLVSLYTLIQYYGYDPYLKGLPYLSSTIGQKNWISNYLAMIFPMIFSYFLLEKSKRIKIVYFIVLSIVYATLMICQSRGIWISISLTAILAIYIIFKFNLLKAFKENKRWLVLLLITFMIITVIYSTDNPLNKSAITVTERAISTFDLQDSSLNARLLMGMNTLKMIKDKPLFGSGIGTFKMNYLNYQADFIKDNAHFEKYHLNAKEAHNEYLQIGAELGLIGLGIFLSIFFIFFLIIIKYFNKEKSDRRKIIVFGLSLGIVCFLIHSLLTFPLHVPALGSAFFVIVGLTIAYIKNNDASYNDKKNKKLKIANPKFKIFITIIVLFISYFLILNFVIKPYIAELAYFEGVKYTQENNYNNALKSYEYAVKYDHHNGRILHALGSTNYNLGIYDKAEINLKNSLNYSVDVKTFYNLGLVYFQTGFPEKAEEYFKYTLYLDPNFTKSYLKLAYLYAIQEEYDKAIVEWNNILEIEPNFSEKYNVLYFIGLSYKKKEMPDKALEYFLKALQLVPEGNPIEKEIEEEINKIYKNHLNK